MSEQQITHGRLQQTLNHIRPVERQFSIAHGPSSPPLRSISLPDLLDEQCEINGDNECLVAPWTGARWSYNTLQAQSIALAKSLLQLNLQKGDRIGILAGNCEQYAAVFFATTYIGCILVILNGTYTAEEAKYALQHSGCRVLFMTPSIGRIDNSALLYELGPHPGNTRTFDPLEHVFLIREQISGFTTYDDLILQGSKESDKLLNQVRETIDTLDVCNLQYTSGSTGKPKAAMLTHHGLVNNSHSIGSRLNFDSNSVLCCPPPLFHCFGLVLGLLVCINHGSKIVLPSDTFDANATLVALSDENCTALHGVPAMFEEILKSERPEGWQCKSLRTGIIAGSPVPRPLMNRLVGELGMSDFTSSYGLTEASPTCFNAHTYDSINTRLTTVGSLLPHLHAKVIDRYGNIVPMGQRGELLISGYSLQKGYWQNTAKTNESMIFENGIRWLKTGDEASFVLGRDGVVRCTITGRFKDIIIRGGENIYPLEIEDRLLQHPSISRAIVVGIQHHKFVEVVGAFLELAPKGNGRRPSNAELQSWVREKLSWHKAPAHIFWFGDEDVGLEVPMTGSGKIKKHVLRSLGDNILAARGVATGARC